MKTADYLKWYEELLKQFTAVKKIPMMGGYRFDRAPAQAWMTEAASALAEVFPQSHTSRKEWERLLPQVRPGDFHGGSFEELFGVLQAATQLLRDNRLSSLLDAVRAETVDELLDQAANLLGAKHLVAASVIAGGALETHLRHLVTRYGLVIVGDGSISKYDGAIAKARNDGTATVYSQTDGKLVVSWGGIRNDAAHDPANFTRSSDDVKRMIDGIREFIARTS